MEMTNIIAKHVDEEYGSVFDDDAELISVEQMQVNSGVMNV
jgi:hypothetical protein